MRPPRLVDINRWGWTASSRARRRPALGALARNAAHRLPPAGARALSAAERGHPGRRLAADPQHGQQRRQPAAAHALLYFYDVGVPCNKREPGSGCPPSAAGAPARDPGRQRALHRDPSVRHVRGARRAGRRGARAVAARRAHHPLRRLPPPARRPPGPTPRWRTGELITHIELPPAPRLRAPTRPTSRCASACPMPSRWCRWRRRWTWTATAPSAPRASPWAAWRTSPGASGGRALLEGQPAARNFERAAERCCRAPGAGAGRATTPSRSRWRGAPSCARWRPPPRHACTEDRQGRTSRRAMTDLIDRPARPGADAGTGRVCLGMPCRASTAAPR
jgi:hypothetical protein